MKTKTFIVIGLLCSCMAMVAQEKKAKDSLQKKKIQVVDSIVGTQISGDFPKVVVATNVKDTVVYSLDDIIEARTIDSLWLNELKRTGRFEEMYGAMLAETYEPVPYEELSTEVLKERLAALNAKTPFNVEYNPALESVIKGYLKNRRRTMARLMALSDYYFPLFEETLDKHNLPLELKYLAIVESALDPRAQSPVGAKGLWQFMFATGKIFGLDVNSYVDERNDPIMATEAASAYLKSLYTSLQDWDLALAAYNSGPGNVAKALRRAGGYTNYWNIRHHLPRETAGYLPAFLATMYIFEYAEEHGFKSEGPMYPYIATDTVHVKKMITLEQVSKVTQVDLGELEFLNPSYKLGIIPVIKDETYVLRLPVEALGKFVANEDAIYSFAEEEFNEREKPLPKFFESSDRIRYRVRSGDFLGKIANKYGVSVSKIKRWNNLRSDRLRVGQRLTIYPRKPAASTTTQTNSVADSNAKKTYTVKSGDSLWSIAQKFPGVSVDKIKKWNDISGNNLKPGMKLKIHKG
ncbi:LysM peptidoglycan-binding domain-containing protein [Altibacter sp. HG106]|uniref:LysM peptidoglycan-binding domain-containing protein n=1 Tax=Altibacter sp. HG106 TaxID=3023937 RepID=UPI0023507CDC|nr:LysM peptidoglycan-binding domain-containing protein [Altibacter sp. HG106]MDC7994991.1 LysM peptidoglycan-binding domain-containing protein [Altibacter sp. HG106]